MNIVTIQTDNTKLDEAYKNMQIHISSFNDFDTFDEYFKDVIKTDDYEVLSKWLLKVLFAEFKYGRTEQKHDFDVLLENTNEANKQQLINWLKTNLEKSNKQRR